MEVLIASVIFAMVMLITTGVVAQSNTSRSKLKTQREVSEETRKLADLLTREIRTANSNLTISNKGVPVPSTFKNGIALMFCTGPNACDFVNAATPSAPGEVKDSFSIIAPFHRNANVLIIATSNLYKVYISDTHVPSGTDFGLYYKEYNRTPTTILTENSTTNDITSTLNVSNLISAKDPSGNAVLNDTRINFGGFCPDDSLVGTPQQPYVQFFISSRTKDYNNLQNSFRAMAKLRTIVTSRSYNN